MREVTVDSTGRRNAQTEELRWEPTSFDGLTMPGVLLSRRPAVYSWEGVSTDSDFGRQSPSDSQAKLALFEYIELFYNRRRRHSSLGYVSPAEYKRTAEALR